MCAGLCFFFKQKTADEMRISDWSSDVCSSDLRLGVQRSGAGHGRGKRPRIAAADLPAERGCRGGVTQGSHLEGDQPTVGPIDMREHRTLTSSLLRLAARDRTGVVSGKCGSVGVDLGGGVILKNKKSKKK